MNQFYFTNKGLEYISLTTEGKSLVFTQGQFGSGKADTEAEILALNGLKSPLGTLPITKKSIDGNTVTIQTQFSNQTETGYLPAFNLTEMGLFAKLQVNGVDDPDNPATLVAYACASGNDAGDYISQTLTEFIVNWPFAVANTDSVVCYTSSTAYLPKIEYEEGMSELNETLAPINSPVFTGTPEAPTAAIGTNSTQIATTAFVYAIIRCLFGSYTWYIDTDTVKDKSGESLGTLADCMTDDFTGTWFYVRTTSSEAGSGAYPSTYDIDGANGYLSLRDYVIWTGSRLIHIPVYEAKASTVKNSDGQYSPKSGVDGYMSSTMAAYLTDLMKRYIAACDPNSSYNSGSGCEESGFYGNVTSGRPAGINSGETLNMLSIKDKNSKITSQLAFSKTGKKAWFRGSVADEWLSLITSDDLITQLTAESVRSSQWTGWLTQKGIYNCTVNRDDGLYSIMQQALIFVLPGAPTDVSGFTPTPYDITQIAVNKNTHEVYYRYSKGYTGSGSISDLATSWTQIMGASEPADNSVTTAKIKNGAVTTSKLDTDVRLRLFDDNSRQKLNGIILVNDNTRIVDVTNSNSADPTPTATINYDSEPFEILILTGEAVERNTTGYIFPDVVVEYIGAGSFYIYAEHETRLRLTYAGSYFTGSPTNFTIGEKELCYIANVPESTSSSGQTVTPESTYTVESPVYALNTLPGSYKAAFSPTDSSTAVADLSACNFSRGKQTIWLDFSATGQSYTHYLDLPASAANCSEITLIVDTTVGAGEFTYNLYVRVGGTVIGGGGATVGVSVNVFRTYTPVVDPDGDVHWTLSGQNASSGGSGGVDVTVLEDRIAALEGTASALEASQGSITIEGTDGKTYIGRLKTVNGKPVFEYEAVEGENQNE